MADAGGAAPGPHAEIPLATDVTLLRSVIEACPAFDEDVFRRELDGDPTLQDDLEAGRVIGNPLILVEAPPGSEEEGYDYGSGEYGHFEELSSILYEAEREFVDRYGAEQAQQDAPEQGGLSE
jgi:hypothetical protein